MNYNREQKTMFEQNKKVVKVDWRKLLDMELHELYRFIDTLLTIWRATVTRETEFKNNIEEKGINVGSLSHDIAWPQIDPRNCITRRIQVRNFRAFSIQFRPSTKWLSLVPLHQAISGRSETEVWSRHKALSAGLATNFFEEGIQKLLPR